ncbi:MAG: hypothetical protein IPL10_03640 [Bacteroidetes bacterium]|nr:hypothetical protein [Bacteroidota bacterium]
MKTFGLIILFILSYVLSLKGQCGFFPLGPDDHYNATFNGASDIRTAKDLNGTIYSVSTDNVFYKPRVMKYIGGVWEDLGNPALSFSQVDNLDIAVDVNGIPYVLFRDISTTAYKPTVMKYNGSAWVSV